MRIAFIHPHFPTAEGTGATHTATQVVNGLAETDHDVCVYCAETPSDDLETPGVEYRYLTGNSRHPHTDTRLNEEVTARLDEFGEYDVVHSYLMSLIPAIAAVGKETDAGTVVTLNAYQGVCPKNDLLYLNERQCERKSIPKCLNCIARTGFENEEYGYCYRTASQLFSLRLVRSAERRLAHVDAFRAPSDHVRENYVRFGYDRDRIHVVPHPVDEEFSIDHRSDFAEPYGLLYVGSLIERKGVKKLIPILEAATDGAFDFELTVVGTGGLESTLREQAAERGVDHLVEFAGFVPNAELPPVYAEHDCFVYPGIWEEPLARVYLEALATGTPIVSSEYGAVAEIIGEGGVTTDGSVGGFREAILRLVRGDRLRALSRGGKRKAREYDRERVLGGLLEIYGAVSDRGRGSEISVEL
ncbi:glycosyltransferase family 4 protein [Salinilacihabitans rarus]|uniref:glycosyltransferase family 4 protein n=1 Tax=Salinilacihabitans rarus TaxID=2961596 RepID=UPI00211566A0|nr:glycosyltransferase family 4 protein [Salinilacihabitans rarus]